MFLVDKLILLGAALLVVGIVSSKFSQRLGLPVLVLFLGVGMLAGEDGLGRIAFDNFAAAHAIGTVALAIILFDGGLQTRTDSLRVAWKPAALLATLGVLVTAGITGLAASFILSVSLVEGMLLGSIVASTDAAAVFSVLRSQGLHLRRRVAATLEIESGSNDPMAIFLTLGLIQLLTGQADSAWDLAVLFLSQMGIGTAVGLGVGRLTVIIINGIGLGSAGLYPVLAGACGCVAFGLAAVLGGSGFLSIYLAGIVVGNSRIVFQRGTFMFMDALAWMGQIAMFVVLGLLSTPSELVPVAAAGLLVAGVLIFVARPLAVVPLLWPFRYSWREQVLIAWVGLKGAVPIILATFPLLFSLPNGRLLFDAVFFIVLVSAVLQGWTLPFFAARLGLHEEKPPGPAASLELVTLREVDADILDYVVPPGSWLVGKMVVDLHLPESAVVAMIARKNTLVPPRGTTALQPGDHLFVIARQEARAAIEEALRINA